MMRCISGADILNRCSFETGLLDWQFRGRLIKNATWSVDRLCRMSCHAVHDGCVNSICWSDDGTLLLSGSDDKSLVICDPLTSNKAKVLCRIQPGHRGNIFSARFLAEPENRHVVSCSSCGLVALTDVEVKKSWCYLCFPGTTYEVCPVPFESHLWLCCGDDRTIRLFDRRATPSGCQPCSDNILLQCNESITALDCNMFRSSVFAVGTVDGAVLLFDRRRLQGFQDCIGVFCCPGGWGRRVTSLDFDRFDSIHLVCSFSQDHVYLLDTSTSNPYTTSLVEKWDQKGPWPGIQSGSKIRRIRLRGDWSDTGPQSRPESEISETGGTNLLENFSRLLTQWVSNRRDPAQPNQTENERNPSGTENTSEAMPAALNQRRSSEPTSVVSDLSMNRVSSNAIDSNQDANDLSDDSMLQNRVLSFDNCATEELQFPCSCSNVELIDEASTSAANSNCDHSNFVLWKQPQMRCATVFSGHRNARTVLKQAGFWGSKFVLSGSDCGHIFVWRRDSGELVQLLPGDSRVVNCVQPHPQLPILASSGIDHDIKLWAPIAEQPTFSASLAFDLCERNKRMLTETAGTATVPAAFLFRILTAAARARNRSNRNTAAADASND